MKLKELKNKKILILGYGREGKITEKFLKKLLPDLEIGIADQSLDPYYLLKQKNYDLAVKTPGIPKRMVEIPYTTATNIFFANLPKGAVVIGITGSKGKSTTASLIYEILKTAGLPVHLAGNIGEPMLNELLNSVSEKDIFVLELSSYQLEDIKYSPHISVIINLFPEHMDYHGGKDKYYKAKMRIIKFSKPKDFFIFNPKYKELEELSKKTKVKSIPFISKIPFEMEEISNLIGEHNKENIRAVVTVVKIFGVKNEIIFESLKNFKPLPHRLENIGVYNGVTFYDDAISTTPESTIAAIYALSKIKPISTIILGGTDRGYDFKILAKEILKAKIKNIVLFPESGKRILESLNKSFGKDINRLNILETSLMDEAVKFAYKNSPLESICLLSTASPSYSLFKNFEEKGDLFKKAVKETA